ncbi:MAG TPA: phosphatase PAP2 family protein [Actinospica sp.]|jgi:membrane-associated phospholipid phosphatase|nr:phosphatase PAP2 family protein [Actinospica sp.]
MSEMTANHTGTTNNVTSVDDGWYRDVTGFAQHTHWLVGTMDLLTVALIVLLAGLVVGSGLLAWRRNERVRLAAALWTLIGGGISIACGLALKQVFQETRPCLALPHVATVQACPGPADYSFPSDHTIVAAAFAAGLWLIDRRLGAIGTALALLEGFSRVYLGQHYPHDVVAALLLSSLIVLGGWRPARTPLLWLELKLLGSTGAPEAERHAPGLVSHGTDDQTGSA